MFIYIGDLGAFGVDAAVYINAVDGRYLILNYSEDRQPPLFA